MPGKTCAACEGELDSGRIDVTIGGDIVELCCDACAVRLNEAHAAAVAPEQG
ncbi:MAG: hypothetical protein JWN66_1182 [Sphingomonas bacterium]|uniref:hypothetical protein n=1 Tax=Sphingomonas bacterium TaxID=1895847 RepID=UPI0026111345|nr:hypothetical protein [Sphingomonas bacterium]MDB5704066.1 hypothetical protein [Sphingomonas bacterium]